MQPIRAIRVAFVFLAFAVAWCHVAIAETASEVAKKVAPSVVLLVMEDSNGQPLAMGSGFVIKDGVVATNMHVIDGASRGYAKLAERKEKFNISGTVATDAARDIALLAVDDLKAPTLTLGDSKQVAVGDDIYAVGNPRGLEGTFSAGIISSIRNVGNDSLLQITAPISPGSSGGPVVNSKGEVVGVAVATFKGGQNLNFAIPSAYLSALIVQAKVAVPLATGGKRPLQPKAKSILEDLGGRSAEGVSVAQFSWDTVTGDGAFSLSLRNNLRDAVRGVYCLAIFCGKDGKPIDVALVAFRDVIPGGLAKRVTGRVDKSVEMLNTPEPRFPNRNPPVANMNPIEFRVLYFDLVTDDEPRDRRSDATPVPTFNARVIPTQPFQPDARGPAGPVDAQAALREAEKKLAETVANLAPAGDGPDLIETTTDGQFNGWEGETIFKLANGQIWQQVTFNYTYHYAFRPRVMIFKTYGAYKMKVDGVNATIFVKRIR